MDKAVCRKFIMEARCSKIFRTVLHIHVSVLTTQSISSMSFFNSQRVGISYLKKIFRQECPGRKDLWSALFSC